MKKKLWQQTNNLSPLIEDYTSGDDLMLDQQLVWYDIIGSLAHVQMLEKQNLIDNADHQEIKHKLFEIIKLYQNGNYQLEFGDEDIHTKIENDLSEQSPESAAKLHTGRSRNDQILTDTRLYTKHKLITIALELSDLATVFIDQANSFSQIPLPGMTHMQPAMLSSFGLWLGSFAESLLDDLALLTASYDLNNQSPLGSGAGYGVSLPLDRTYTSELLGFKKVQSNSLYCQNSKGKIEASVLFSLSQVMATLNKFASDCLLYTTEPFSFITFDQNLGTGSSIMPQKQNWDALELVRAKYHQVISAQQQVSATIASLPSGYNRDSQQIKKPLIESIQVTFSSLQVTKLFVASLTIDQQKIQQHIPKELFATHWAYMLVQEKNLPFRNAYHYVKKHLSNIPDFDMNSLLNQTTSQGSTGNLQLNKINAQIRRNQQYWHKEKLQFEQTLEKLLKNKGSK